jgi:hypothetical protein
MKELLIILAMALFFAFLNYHAYRGTNEVLALSEVSL